MKTKAYFIITFSLFLLISVVFQPSSPKTLELPKASAVATVQSNPPIAQPVETTTETVELTQKQVVENKPKTAPAAAPKKVTAPPPAPKPRVEDCSRTFNTQFLCLLNEYRRSKKLNAVSYDAALNATAVAHSAWMNANNSLSHVGQDSSKFFERCKQQQTSCDAENVAMGYTTAQKLFDAWKNSPGHDANMLGSHTKIGLGLVGKYSTLVLR